MTDETHHPNKHPVALTQARKSKFLAVLRQTGNMSLAAREASPHLRDSPNKSPALSTFKRWMAQDGNFNAHVEAAREEAAATLVEELRRRGYEGVLEPVYQSGRRVMDVDPDTGEEYPATVRKYSDKLLLTLVKAMLPREFGDRKQIDITHKNDPSNLAGWTISMSDVAMLGPEQRNQLAEIMQTIRRSRGEQVAKTDHMVDVTPVEGGAL